MMGKQQKSLMIKQKIHRWWLVVGICLVTATSVFAGGGEAPLDTLRTEEAISEEKGSRYKGVDIDSSRKKLPDVQATVVPKTKQPRKPPRLTHPLSSQWYFHKARLEQDKDSSQENLLKALAISPDNPTFQSWQISQAVKNLDSPTVLSAVPRAFATMIESPVAKGRMVVRWHQGAILIVAWFWTLLVIAIFFSVWPNLVHDLGAMIFKNRNHTPKVWLPVFIPLAFVALRPGWLGFLALMSIVLLIQTRGKLRNLLVVTWIAAIVLVFPAWPILHLAPPAIDPESEVNLLTDACLLEPSGVISERLRQALRQAQNPDRAARLQVALGIQEARRGRFGNSDKYFKNVLKIQPDNFSAQVGLANNTYYRGSLDTALRRYQQAQKGNPNRGQVSYNMAQVYFKKLFIPEATAALEKSRELGYLAPSHMDNQTKKQDFSPVIYPGLSSKNLHKACSDEAENYPPLVTLSAWKNLLGSPPLPLFLILVVPFLLAIIVTQWWSHQNDPRECKNCGLPVCRDCCRVRDSVWLCPACGETASRSRSDVVLATLLKNQSRKVGMKNSQRIVNLGRFLPGAGHLASGHVVAGFLRISALAWGLFLVSSSWIFDSGAPWKSPGMILPEEMIRTVWAPLPESMWTGWFQTSVLVGIGLIIISLIIGLLDGRNLRRGMPERFSWAPTERTGRHQLIAKKVPVNQPSVMAGGPGLRRP